MATGDDLRRIALSLEGTSEAPHFDRAAFRVARIYVTLAADGQTANLKLEPGEQEFKCLLAPEVFSPVSGGWGRMGWTTIIWRMRRRRNWKPCSKWPGGMPCRKRGKRAD